MCTLFWGADSFNCRFGLPAISSIRSDFVWVILRGVPQNVLSEISGGVSFLQAVSIKTALFPLNVERCGRGGANGGEESGYLPP